MSNKYVFKTGRNLERSVPISNIYKYYQLCGYKNVHTELYDCRCTYVDNLCNIRKVQEYELPADIARELIKKMPEKNIILCPTNSIDNVGYPSTDILMKVISDLA